MQKIWNKRTLYQSQRQAPCLSLFHRDASVCIRSGSFATNTKQLMRTDWEHFSLLENGLTLSLQLHNHTDSDWCLWYWSLFYIAASVTIVSRSSCTVKKLARMILENKWYEADTVQDSGSLSTAKQIKRKNRLVSKDLLSNARDCFISAVKSRWGNIKTSFYG